MVLSHHSTTRFVWAATIVIILVDLTVIEAVAHVQCILIIVVYHTLSMSFTRLSKLVLIVSTVTTGIDYLFLMLIAVGSICLRYHNTLHKVVVLWNHAALIRSMSITWISHLLLARLVVCFSRHGTWTNAATRLIIVVNAFHVLGNDVIFTLVLRSMRSRFTLKTWVWLSGRMILLVDVAVKCIVVRRITAKTIYIVQAYLGLMQQLSRTGRSVILVTAQIQCFLLLCFRGRRLVNIVGVTDALVLNIETRSTASLPRWSSNGLWATRSLTSAGTNHCLILAVDVVWLIWTLSDRGSSIWSLGIISTIRHAWEMLIIIFGIHSATNTAFEYLVSWILHLVLILLMLVLHILLKLGRWLCTTWLRF